jgi:hypothetical protein
MLFGIYGTTNVIEAARISTARNFLIGTTTDNGAKLQVSGSSTVSTSLFIGVNNSVTPYTAAFKVGASGSTFFVRDNAAEAYFIGPSINYFGTATAGSSLYLVSNNGSTTMVLSGSNNVLIGTTTDNGDKLQIQGNARSYGSNAGYFFDDRTVSTFNGLYSTGNTIFVYNFTNNNIASINTTTGIYTPLSDKNKKKNFEAANLGLDAILKLKPTLYNMISQKDNETKELGFIAQEVKEVIEQAYVQSGEFIGLNYQAIVTTLVKAIQELNAKIENLK